MFGVGAFSRRCLLEVFANLWKDNAQIVAGKLGNSHIFLMQMLTKMCYVLPRHKTICLCHYIPIAQLWQKYFTVFSLVIRDLARNKGVEMVICGFTQRTRKHVAGGRKKTLARILLDFSMPEQQRCYWLKLSPGHSWAGRPPELRNRLWSPQKDPGPSHNN